MQPKQARIQELFTPNCSTVYVFGSKAYSHEGKQTAVSVFCPVIAEFTHHDPDKIPPYVKMCRFKTQVHLRYPLALNRNK